MEHNWKPRPQRPNNWICSNCGVLRFIRNPGEYCYHSPQIPGYYSILEEPFCGKILTDKEKMEILLKEAGIPENEKQTKKAGIYQFQIGTHESAEEVYDRINGIYLIAKKEDEDVFKEDIRLEPNYTPKMFYYLCVEMLPKNVTTRDI